MGVDCGMGQTYAVINIYYIFAQRPRLHLVIFHFFCAIGLRSHCNTKRETF
jgi:hypothetical protein